MAYYWFVAERTSPETVPGEPPGTALFEQVEREPKLSDKVAEMMLETILSRRLEAGARLPSERELGEQFGVSRTVVREAVRALAAKGVIEVRSGSGLRVASVGPATVNESMSLYLRGGQIEFEKVHEVRSMLEVHIAGLAAERAADEDVATLAAVEAQMEAAIGDADAAAVHDLEFHRVIARATHNDLYLVLMDSIGRSHLDIRRANLGGGHSGPATVKQHRAILAAIRDRDPVKARSAMTAHLQQVARIWRRAQGSETRKGSS